MNDYTEQIKKFYKNFNIVLDIIKIVDSYSVTRYFIKLDRTNKTKITNVEKLVDDLGVELNVKNIKFTIDFENGGIVFEIPKKTRQTLYFDDLQSPTNAENGLQVCFGKDLNNNDFMVNLCETPHLLIAGTTGSGKSMFINSILINLLKTYKKDDLELYLIDPKRVELNIYKDTCQVKAFVDTLEKTKSLLALSIAEIEERYKKMEKINCRNIISYNKKTTAKLPYKLIIIDELADIILQDKKNKLKNDLQGFDTLENQIVRIAQIGRACGVHLIVATQRPSSDVITGLIKANIPSRVAFSVSSKIDSRIILDEKGAEKLTGKGDLLFKMVGDEELHRLQAPLVTDENIEKIVANNKDFSKINEAIEKEQQKKKQLRKEIQETKKAIEKEKRKAIALLTIKFLGILIFPCSTFLFLMFLLWQPGFWIMILFIISMYIFGVNKTIKKYDTT